MEWREVQGELRRFRQPGDHRLDRKLPGEAPALASTPATIEEVDFSAPYIAALESFVDLKAIKASGYRFLIDTMYGAGKGYIAGIFERAGIPYVSFAAR